MIVSFTDPALHAIFRCAPFPCNLSVLVLGNMIYFRVVLLFYLIYMLLWSIFLFVFIDCKNDSSVYSLVVRECISLDLGSAYPQGICHYPSGLREV